VAGRAADNFLFYSLGWAGGTVAKFENNVVVVGGGSAGLIAALIAATVNARVTLVEKGDMGGDCLNTGCVPSKTLIRSAKMAQYQRVGERFGLARVVPQVDFPRVMGRVQEVIASIAPKDSMARYRELGVNCIAGEGRLLDSHHVAVGEDVVSARSIVLATGASPFVPPIPGLAEANPLTSDNLWALQELPGHLLIMGGGPIGCELAQSFARLGAKVTLIDMEDRLLPREDPDVSSFAARTFSAEGIDVRLSHRAVRVVPGSSGSGALEAETAAGTTSLGFDRILVAVGRRAHTDGLGLEGLGIGVNPNGTVDVDAYLRTSVANVFACGDVVGPYQFTHMAAHQAWYAAVNALFGRFWKFRVNYSVVPWVTFTDPEIARVGLSEADAKAQDIRVEVVRFDLGESDRALADGAAEGWVKVLTQPGTDRILGVSIVGPHAGELLAEYVLAMTHGLGLKKIMATIHVYPTLAEANKFAAGVWRRQHAPEKLLRWVGGLHRLLR
jgi:pyruvate/2-oxoglutarate dehydrogenase complex dihydrolipoamide dehydrogenase (E3) component